MSALDISIHSYSVLYNYRLRPGFDVFAYIDYAVSRGFSGLNLSLNGPGWRHLSGQSDDHLDRVRRKIEQHDLSLEIDTADTDPEHMKVLLRAGERLGAKSLRTFTRHRGPLDEMMQKTAKDLRAVAPHAKHAGIEIGLENHEEFTGSELAEVIREVDSDYVHAIYDFGNSHMVGETPHAALDAMIPYVKTVHVKDHSILRPQDSPDGKLSVLGVPFGDGSIPIMELTERLLEKGLRRFVFQNVWSYRTQINRLPDPSLLGSGPFRFADPPFDNEIFVPDVDDLIRQHPLRVCELENAANERSLAWFRKELIQRGWKLKSPVRS